MTTPAQMALEYRIWAFASPLGWNVTPGEIAAELGLSKQMVGVALRRKGWQNRVRTTRQGKRADSFGGGNAAFGRYLADDVAHGRINMSVD